MEERRHWTSIVCGFVIIFFVCSNHDTSQNLLDGHYDRYTTLVYISGSCIASFDFRKVLKYLSAYVCEHGSMCYVILDPTQQPNGRERARCHQERSIRCP